MSWRVYHLTGDCFLPPAVTSSRRIFFIYKNAISSYVRLNRNGFAEDPDLLKL